MIFRSSRKDAAANALRPAKIARVALETASSDIASKL
jgi:hypothetical protein